jgi:hypothetical protein
VCIGQSSDVGMLAVDLFNELVDVEWVQDTVSGMPLSLCVCASWVRRY